MNKQWADKWIEALESGRYEQGRSRLAQKPAASDSWQFCCLGVLCELVLQGTMLVDEEGLADGTRMRTYAGYRDILPARVRDKVGMASCDGTIEETTPSLTVLNDGRIATTELPAVKPRDFKEIAQYIRANWARL